MADAVGAVRYVLGADSAELEKALEKTKRSFGTAAQAGQAAGAQIGGAMTRMAGVLAAAFSVDAIVRFAQHAVQAGAAIGRLADQAGLSTREFQELQFALRRSGVEGEQMAAAFAVFSRNISDLQRGTGPFLDFLRRSAPQLIEQYQRTRNVSEAFELLAEHLSQLGDRHDQLRFAQAAGSEQMGKLAIEAARLGTGLQAAREEAQRTGRVLTDQTVRDLRDAQQAWKDLGDELVIATGRFIAWVARGQAGRGIFGQMSEETRQLAGTLGGLTTAMVDASERLRVQAERTGATMLEVAGKLGRLVLDPDAIRAAQGQLALFMAQLQTLPPQTEFISTSFAAAWERMRAVMVANTETAAAQSAARLNLLRQEDAARQQILAGVITGEEQLQRRRDELHQARRQQLITEAELNRALMVAELQRAQSTLSAAGSILNSMATIFNKQKGWAYAAATVNAAAAVAGALASPPYWPYNALQVAAAVAAGAAQLATISRTTMSGGGSVPSVGGGVSTAPQAAPAPQQPMTAVTLNLPDGMHWSTEQVYAMVKELNQYTLKGGTLLSSGTR